MNRVMSRSLLFYCCLCVTTPAAAQDAADEAGGGSDVLVYPVQTVSAEQVTGVLQSLYGDVPGFRITTTPRGQTLLLRVDAGIRDDVLTVLESVDPPACRLEIHVALIHQQPGAEPIADTAALSGLAEEVWNTIHELERRRQINVSDRIQLTALANQQTLVQIGQQRPVVTGVSIASGGNAAAIHEFRNTGTLLTIRGRTAPDGEITLELQFEKSEIVELPDSEIHDGIPAAGTDSTVFRSTVSLRSGTAVLLSAAGSDDEWDEDTFLIVTASVVQPGDSSVAGAFNRSGRLETDPRTQDRRSRSERGFPLPGGDQVSQMAEAVFQRMDQNNDGVLQPGEVPESLSLNIGDDMNLETFRARYAELVASRSGRPGLDSSPFRSGQRGSFGRTSGRPRGGLLGTLLRDEVSNALGLSDDALAMVRELSQSDPLDSETRRDLFQRMRDASDEDRQQLGNELTAIMRRSEEEAERRIEEIIEDSKFARLKQLHLQYTGGRALMTEEVAEALNLTNEQKLKIEQVATANIERRRPGGTGRISSEDRAELEQQENQRYFEVLTDEQREAWLEMVGEVLVDNGTPQN